MRRNAKKDGNQDEIAGAIEGCGLKVRKTHQLGDGFPDLAVGGVRRCNNELATLLVEVKIPGEEDDLTPAESKFANEWPGTYMRTSDFEDVLRWFGLLDGEYSRECVVHE